MSNIINTIRKRYLKKEIYNLNKYLFNQEEKVSYAYKNLVNGDYLSFNNDICFYCASAIKFLVCLYIYEKAEKDNNLLNTKLLITKEDLKRGTGVLKDNTQDKEYTIRELVYYTLKESDNTAYIKLVNYVTPEKLKVYGLSLKAIHTLEGKDLFGITSAHDMTMYLTHLYEYFKTDTKNARELKVYMSDPSYKIIEDKNIDNNLFVRKYGSFEIAYHEVGIVYSEDPYILIILTEKGKLPDERRKEYINKVAKKINEIHNKLNKYL